jgi:D-3-phosphoglycerate dehydrogenase
MKLFAFEPLVTFEVMAGYGIEKQYLSVTLRRVDLVTISTSLTYTTRDLIGEYEFMIIKPTAYLINTARAEVVERMMLYSALRSGRIAGAAFDVFWAALSIL